MSIRQRAALDYYMVMFHLRFNVDPQHSKTLVCNLGDSPWERLSWNVASGRLLAFRTNGGKQYYPHIGRWFLHKELMTTMGLPLYEQCARAAGVPLMETPPPGPSKAFMGNMMHVPSVGCMLLVALGCAQPVE